MNGPEALRTVAPLRTLGNATAQRAAVPGANPATVEATGHATPPPRRSIRALAERVLEQLREREKRNDPSNDAATTPLPEPLQGAQRPSLPRHDPAGETTAPRWLWVHLDSKRFECHVLLVRDDEVIVPADLAGLVRFTWREVATLLEKPDFLEAALRVKGAFGDARLQAIR